jgi:hypothetical protein
VQRVFDICRLTNVLPFRPAAQHVDRKREPPVRGGQSSWGLRRP